MDGNRHGWKEDIVEENVSVMGTRKFTEIYTEMLLYLIIIFPSLLSLRCPNYSTLIFLLLSNNSRTSVGHMKKLLAYYFFLTCSLSGSCYHSRPLRGCQLFWAEVFQQENSSTGDAAVSSGGMISNKVRVGVTSIPVLDTDLARCCEGPRCRGPW